MPNKKDAQKIGSVGRSVFHADIRIVDKEGKKVRPGEVGELILKGPTQMIGYWNNPEETAKTIRDGWLYTGDLAKMDEEGDVYSAKISAPVYQRSHCEASRTDDPRGYHREYYRKVRRHREGRTPRIEDEAPSKPTKPL